MEMTKTYSKVTYLLQLNFNVTDFENGAILYISTLKLLTNNWQVIKRQSFSYQMSPRWSF